MKISVDTNVLLRLLLQDDDAQHRLALEVLDGASLVALPTVALCEVAWVLGRTYGLSRDEIAEMLVALTEIENTEYEPELVAAGLAMLEVGGDFADGVIARQGQDHGAEMFVSFDQRAVRKLSASGLSARLPGGSA